MGIRPGDLLGTGQSQFQIGGTSGGWLQYISSKFRARNPANLADTEFVASKLSSSGSVLGLNEAATQAGADWKLDLERSLTGMTGNVRIILPPDFTPTINQVMSVTAVSAGVITLGYQTIAVGSNLMAIDGTLLAFGSGTTVACFGLPANALFKEVFLHVDTAWNTAATVSVGIAGDTAKYMPASFINLQNVDIYSATPQKIPVGTAESIIMTYSAASATAGSARLYVGFAVPS